MGLIKALSQGVRSSLADQWLEYIYCDSLPMDVLMRKGQKRVGKGSSNTKGSDNIITKGSKIAVNEGQFLLVVDDGKIVDFTDEAGDYTYDKSSEPSLFYGGFGKGLIDTFNLVGKRFAFGGDTGHDQRVYYINKKLITDNKFGTKAPIPFRDSEWQMTVKIRCFGTYVYKVVNPLLFFANLCGNVAYEYKADEIAEQFKSDLIGALLPAMTKVAMTKISYDMLPGSTDEITKAIQQVLKADWEDKVGINVDRVVLESVSPTDEDAQKIQKLQETRVYTNSAFAGAAMNEARAGMVTNVGEGMAKGNNGNSSTPVNDMMGMMGMAMMGNMMGTGSPFAPANNNTSQPGGANYGINNNANPMTFANGAAAQIPIWKCECGAENTGKFCMQCGKKKPDEGGNQEAAAPTNTEWKCECGAVNTGKFCSECGKKKPLIKRYKCNKCGFVPSDPSKPPKFCPNCGDIFNEDDAQ